MGVTSIFLFFFFNGRVSYSSLLDWLGAHMLVPFLGISCPSGLRIFCTKRLIRLEATRWFKNNTFCLFHEGRDFSIEQIPCRTLKLFSFGDVRLDPWDERHQVSDRVRDRAGFCAGVHRLRLKQASDAGPYFPFSFQLDLHTRTLRFCVVRW